MINGSKTWTSTAQRASKILILVRTAPLSKVTKPSQGLSLFYTPLDRAAVSIAEIPKMGRAAVDTNTLHFSDWRVPAADRIGVEGAGSVHPLPPPPTSLLTPQKLQTHHARHER